MVVPRKFCFYQSMIALFFHFRIWVSEKNIISACFALLENKYNPQPPRALHRIDPSGKQLDESTSRSFFNIAMSDIHTKLTSLDRIT